MTQPPPTYAQLLNAIWPADGVEHPRSLRGAASGGWDELAPRNVRRLVENPRLTFDLPELEDARNDLFTTLSASSPLIPHLRMYLKGTLEGLMRARRYDLLCVVLPPTLREYTDLPLDIVRRMLVDEFMSHVGSRVSRLQPHLELVLRRFPKYSGADEERIEIGRGFWHIQSAQRMARRVFPDARRRSEWPWVSVRRLALPEADRELALAVLARFSLQWTTARRVWDIELLRGRVVSMLF